MLYKAKMGLLLMLVAITATGCGGAASTPTQTVIPKQSNTLAIAEPLPGTPITDTVTVRGQGMAFENTIIVEVLVGDTSLGKSVVTTTAEPGQVGSFETSVLVAPVTSDTDGTVTIYTTSPKDGSVDQRASVPVRLLAHK